PGGRRRRGGPVPGSVELGGVSHRHDAQSLHGLRGQRPVDRRGQRRGHPAGSGHRLRRAGPDPQLPQDPGGEPLPLRWPDGSDLPPRALHRPADLAGRLRSGDHRSGGGPPPAGFHDQRPGRAVLPDHQSLRPRGWRPAFGPRHILIEAALVSPG
ncbi:MAG: hypothetical protein ACK55I_32110, partial [bacterium]